MKAQPAPNLHPNRRLRKAFTLVEMLLVLTILGTLAAIVLPNMASHRQRAPLVAGKTQIAAFRTALDTFAVDNGSYPKGVNGLAALVQQPSDAKNWHGPYLDTIPKDPWGQRLHYACSGKRHPASFDISSAGPDGRLGTEDDVANP